MDVLGITDGAEEVAHSINNSVIGVKGRAWIDAKSPEVSRWLEEKLPLCIMRACWVLLIAMGCACVVYELMMSQAPLQNLLLQSLPRAAVKFLLVYGVAELFFAIIQTRLAIMNEQQTKAPAIAADTSEAEEIQWTGLPLEVLFKENQPPRKVALQVVEPGSTLRFMSVEQDPIKMRYFGLLPWAGQRVGLRVQEEGKMTESSAFLAETCATPGTLLLRSSLTSTHLVPLGRSPCLVAMTSGPLQTYSGCEQGGRCEELSFERAEPPEGVKDFECISIRHVQSGLYLSHDTKMFEGFGLSSNSKASKFLLCDVSKSHQS